MAVVPPPGETELTIAATMPKGMSATIANRTVTSPKAKRGPTQALASSHTSPTLGATTPTR